MTFSTSVIAFFCEDIREEKAGGVTLLGIMPDNISVPQAPAGVPKNTIPAITKLCIYLRLHFDPQADLGPIATRIIFPDGTEHPIEAMDAAVVEKARVDTLANGAPIAAVFSRIELAPFLVATMGRMRVEVTIGGQLFLCGALNFVAAGSS